MSDESTPMPPNVLRMCVTPKVAAKNDTEREIVHLITNASMDRAGDIVDPAGAELANYKRNPVVMADHEYRIGAVVGRAVDIFVSTDGLRARTRFRDTPLALDAYKLASEGLGGWSIGFRPIEYDSITDEKGRHKGFRFSKWELLEYSIVAIPMNQEIVQGAVRRGLVQEGHVRTFFTPQLAPSVSGSSRERRVTALRELKACLERNLRMIRNSGRVN